MLSSSSSQAKLDSRFEAGKHGITVENYVLENENCNSFEVRI
jgi:hypothetical protein